MPAPRPVSPPPQDLFTPVLETLSAGVLIVDARRRVLRCNEAVAPWTNRPPKDCAGLPLWDVLRHREAEDMVSRVLASGRPETAELSLSFPSETHWAVAARPFPPQGPPQGAVITFDDLSRLRRLENMRKDFVANVSHELRTPLTALRAALETLLEGALEDPKSARDFLETAQSQVDRLQRLIEDLLVLSRLDRSGPEAKGGAADVRATAEKILKVLGPMAEKSRVTLETRWPEAPLRAAVSADLLIQVLTNLLDNAVKFNRPGGKAVLSARAAGGSAEIVVEDTGAGIAAEDLPRVFERFYRADKARAADTGGTGLGLSIVKHIAENAGGSVRAESAPGRGSRFTVTLPLAR
ncbi:MAG: ATP-binding protein [Elusimicrobiota bacterium]